MADYYPLIARAVAGLEKNTGDTRRALYERARAALVAQLRSVSPALSESDVTRERLALEEAVRKVEAESVRQARLGSRSEPKAKVKPPEMPRWDEPQPAPPRAAEEPPSALPRRAGALPRSDNVQRVASPRSESASEPISTGREREQPDSALGLEIPSLPAPPPFTARPQRPPLRDRPTTDRQSLLNSVNSFRNSVSETDELREAPAQSPKWARRSHPEATAPARDLDRLVPHALDRNSSDELIQDAPAPEMLEPSLGMEEPRPLPNRPRPAQFVREEAPRSFETRVRLITLAMGLLIVSAVGGVLGWQWSNLTDLYRSWRAPPVMEVAGTETPAPASRTKIADRFEPGATNQPQQKTTLTPGASEAPTVAQRVVLYEEDPADPQGKRFVGSAIWRTETISSGAGQPPEVAIRADVEIPDRQLAMTWSLRRNTDPTLPASHTVEITFKLPSDFASGGVSNVPGILMKEAEQARGVPLAGLAVKVTNGFFLIGLSSVDADKERNIALLKEKSWFDIPVVYNNNRRAILALEKGTPGERVFAEAFAAWHQ
ncbi:MAG TPA: hypothetical protein VH684_02410 [Xanthobacteraceae bacterium]|jgi:hypothetical protein